jgi:hypothetical protein
MPLPSSWGDGQRCGSYLLSSFALPHSLTFTSLGCAFAAADEAGLIALRAITSELQACSAYDAVASRCLIGQARKLSDRYAKSATRLESLARKGAVDVSDRAFNAQNVLFLSVLMGATDNSCENLSVLTEAFERFCHRIDSNLDARIKEWIKCAHNNQNDCGGPELP